MTDERPIITTLRSIFAFALTTLTRPTYLDQDNIPRTGTFLLVSNHLSYVDPPLIFVGVNRPGLTVLAADTYKSNPFFRWLIDTAGGVWINRGSGDRGALKAAMQSLKGNTILGMAPEGTRSKTTHALQPGKSGAAFIASKTGVPLLPVGLVGTDKAFAELRRFRRASISFTVGKPFTLPSLDAQTNKGQALEEYTHEIMCRIAALLPEPYHGVYAGDPRIAEIRAEQAHDSTNPA